MPRVWIISFAIMCTAVHGMVQPQQQGSIYESVNSNVHALVAHLSQMEADNRQLLETHKDQYEARLTAQRDTNDAISADNLKLRQEIQESQKGNSLKRKRAALLQADMVVRHGDLQAMRANFSTAFEIINHTLDQKPAQDEVAVLDELDEEDARRAAAVAHDQRLGEVAKSSVPKLVALQLQQQEEADPRGLLKVLNENLKDLQVDYKEKEKRLKHKFEELSDVEDKHRVTLMEEQGELNETKVSLVKLGDRLDRALQVLGAKTAQLNDLSASVRMYAQRVGVRPVPYFPDSSKSPFGDQTDSQKNIRTFDTEGSLDAAHKANISSPTTNEAVDGEPVAQRADAPQELGSAWHGSAQPASASTLGDDSAATLAATQESRGSPAEPVWAAHAHGSSSSPATQKSGTSPSAPAASVSASSAQGSGTSPVPSPALPPAVASQAGFQNGPTSATSGGDSMSVVGGPLARDKGVNDSGVIQGAPVGLNLESMSIQQASSSFVEKGPVAVDAGKPRVPVGNLNQIMAETAAGTAVSLSKMPSSAPKSVARKWWPARLIPR